MTTEAPVPRPTKVEMNGSSKENGSSQESAVREQLYTAFNDALEKTKNEVKQLQEKLKEYDTKFQASDKIKENSQKASDFMHATLEDITKNLESLSNKAKEVFHNATEFAQGSVVELWGQLKESIEKLRSLVKEFDENHGLSTKVSELSAPLLEMLGQFQKNFEAALDSAKELGKSGRSFLIGAAASFELKYGLEGRFKNLDTKFGLSERAKSLQEKGEQFMEKQHVKERILELDEKFTGSKASSLIGEGVKLVKGEIEKVQKEYEEAKVKDSSK